MQIRNLSSQKWYYKGTFLFYSILFPNSLFIIPYFSFLITHSLFLNIYSSILILYASFLIPLASFLIPYSSFLFPYTLFPIPHSLFLIHFSSFLIPHASFLTPCSSLLISHHLWVFSSPYGNFFPFCYLLFSSGVPFPLRISAINIPHLKSPSPSWYLHFFGHLSYFCYFVPSSPFFLVYFFSF